MYSLIPADVYTLRFVSTIKFTKDLTFGQV